MTYDEAFFDKGLDRRGTRSLKWDETSVLAPGDTPLWVADMDFPCAGEIVESMRLRLEHPCYGYSFATEEDFEAFAGFWKTRHRVTLRREDCLTLPCVVSGLKLAVQAFTSPGDGVVIMDPVYGPFEKSVTLNGRTPARCSLIRERNGRYSMDLDAVESSLKKGVRLVLLCNPHNPVSRLWTAEELGALIALVQRYHGILVSDEIHADFVYAPAEFVSVMRFDAFRECGIALCSASKTFNIAGLQQAEAVFGNPDMRKAFADLIERGGVMSGNLFAMIAAATAYRDGGAWLDGLLPYLKANADHMAARCSEALPEVTISPVEATYLGWLDLRAFGFDEETLRDRFRRAGVALTMGTFFGKAYEGFARLNFGCPRGQLDEGLDRLFKALKED